MGKMSDSVLLSKMRKNFYGPTQEDVFVSPELSSGRDLVIQMSVQRAMCSVRHPPSMVFCPEHISRTV